MGEAPLGGWEEKRALHHLYQKAVERRNKELHRLKERIEKYYQQSLIPTTSVFSTNRTWSVQPLKGIHRESVALKAFKGKLEEREGKELVVMDVGSGEGNYIMDILRLLEATSSLELLAKPEHIRIYLHDYSEDAVLKGMSRLRAFLKKRDLDKKVKVSVMVGLLEFVEPPEKADVALARLVLKEIPREWKPYAMARLGHDFLKEGSLLILSEPMVDEGDVAHLLSKEVMKELLMRYPSFAGMKKEEMVRNMARRLAGMMEIFHNRKYTAGGAFVSLRAVELLGDVVEMLEGMGWHVTEKEKAVVSYLLPDAWANQFRSAGDYVAFATDLISTMRGCFIAKGFFGFKEGLEVVEDRMLEEAFGKGIDPYVPYKGRGGEVEEWVKRLYFHLPFWTLVAKRGWRE